MNILEMDRLRELSTFVIKHDTQRYGDQTGGFKRFGERIAVCGVTTEQAWAIADALSGYCDAGTDDQYEVESAENTPALAIAEYERETATVTGPVICPHGKVEVFCSECDLKARAELHDAVALAVMAERERCAKIAETWQYSRKGVNARLTTDGQDMAVKIRSGE